MLKVLMRNTSKEIGPKWMYPWSYIYFPCVPFWKELGSITIKFVIFKRSGLFLQHILNMIDTTLIRVIFDIYFNQSIHTWFHQRVPCTKQFPVILEIRRSDHFFGRKLRVEGVVLFVWWKKARALSNNTSCMKMEKKVGENEKLATNHQNWAEISSKV